MKIEEEVAVEEEVDDLSVALADAWDKSESDDGDTGQQEREISEPAVESGTIAADSFGESGTDGDKPASDTEAVRSDKDTTGKVGDIAAESEKPPVGLSLEAREAWKDVPASVKADIVKRENDYAAGIEKHRNATERVQGMDKALQPYQQYLQMNGGAGQALQGLLQTGSSLQMGSPVQKAQVVANLIKQFGVDISQLDSMLVGEAPAPEQQQQNQFQQMLNQQLAPMQQQLQGYQQREQHQQQQEQGQVAQEVTAFGANNEFYNDVSGDMADLLDMAANRGRQMSMDEAYKLACANHPQISSIMSNRMSQEQVSGKRKAASSIHGSPGGSISSGGAAGSVAAALNDAWDNAGQM
jgi:hypothetical protein